MATKIMTAEAVTEFLSTPAPREDFLLELFEAVDPAQEMSYPDMLLECCKLRGLAAEEARQRGETGVAHRCVKDTLCFAAVANLILGIEDKVARYRLQDIDEPGLARLVELTGWLTPRIKSVEPIVEALRAVLPGIHAYIDSISPPPRPGPTKPKKSAEPGEPAQDEPAPKAPGPKARASAPKDEAGSAIAH